MTNNFIRANLPASPLVIHPGKWHNCFVAWKTNKVVIKLLCNNVASCFCRFCVLPLATFTFHPYIPGAELAFTALGSVASTDHKHEKFSLMSSSMSWETKGNVNDPCRDVDDQKSLRQRPYKNNRSIPSSVKFPSYKLSMLLFYSNTSSGHQTLVSFRMPANVLARQRKHFPRHQLDLLTVSVSAWGSRARIIINDYFPSRLTPIFYDFARNHKLAWLKSQLER